MESLRQVMQQMINIIEQKMEDFLSKSHSYT
jgi:hypothetical protein